MREALVSIPEQEAKLRQVEKIVSSSTLHGSESLCSLLRFLARHSLEHPGVPVKEYHIATEVFGRPSDFDPRLDSTVRVQTGRLRSKLGEYYANGGIHDRLIVEVPKGSYSLVFHLRPHAAPSAADPGSVVRAQVDAAAPARPGAARRSPSALWWLVTGVLAIAFVSAMALNPPWQHLLERRNALHVFWQRFLTSPEVPLVVFSNAAFVGRPESGLRYFNSSIDSNQAILDHYTGVGEVIAIHELDQVFAAFKHPIRVKRGRLLTWDDAKNSDLIFIGSPSENLSLREIPGPQDFVFKVMDSSVRKDDLGIVNMRPREGEDRVYFASGSLPIAEDYAVMGLIPGLNANRCVLILAGTTTLGTQAAVEFVCRPKKLEELFAKLGGAGNAAIAPFEAVLRVRISGGVPVQSQIVALHSHPDR